MNIVMYPASMNSAVLNRDNSAMPGVVWTSPASACTLVPSLPILLSASVALLGRGKILSDCWPVDRDWSVGMLTLEVARLSMMAEGID